MAQIGAHEVDRKRKSFCPRIARIKADRIDWKSCFDRIRFNPCDPRAKAFFAFSRAAGPPPFAFLIRFAAGPW
jgi:hypothetical protein